MEPAWTYNDIWYRAKPATEATRANPFMRERGTLVVEADEVRFQGKTANLVLRNIEALEYGVHGTMTSPSLHVRYRDGDEVRSAWFTDGRMGGYAGMFGGTRRLAQEMSHLAPTTYDDAGAGKMQKRMAYILLILVLVFLTGVLRSALG